MGFREYFSLNWEAFVYLVNTCVALALSLGGVTVEWLVMAVITRNLRLKLTGKMGVWASQWVVGHCKSSSPQHSFRVGGS